MVELLAQLPHPDPAGADGGRSGWAPNGAGSAGTMTYRAGHPASGVFTAPVDGNGAITVATSAATDVSVHVLGWYATPTAGDLGTALDLLAAPTRVADTRSGSATGVCDGGTCPTLSALAETNIAIVGQGGVRAEAAAAVVNVTAINPAGDGVLAVAPKVDAAAALVSYQTWTDASVTGVVPIAEDGTVSVLGTTAVDVTIDVVGVFTRPVDASGERSTSRTRSEKGLLDGLKEWLDGPF